MFHSGTGNTCSWKPLGLYVWNAGSGTGSFPEILTEEKTGIPHMQEHRST